MQEPEYLNNNFLIAMPNLADPNFFHSVTYIVEHNQNGAMGVIVNQPVNMTLWELALQIGMESIAQEELTQTIYRGGPVETDRGFVLHKPIGAWESTLSVTDQIGISSSADVLEALAKGEGPSQSLVALGYAGWGAGQLEQEILDNAWLNGPADSRIIFDTDVSQRWEAAAALIGVDINQITTDVGHA